VARAYPAVEGKLTGLAFRVPVADVSVVDLTVKLQQPVQSIDDIAAAIHKADLPNIIGCTSDAVVSSDFLGDGRSCIFDVKASILLNPTFVKLVAYYDNEWAYAMRMVNTINCFLLFFISHFYPFTIVAFYRWR
jgi:glyceraldehyde 3-phosphate dehydrogenase